MFAGTQRPKPKAQEPEEDNKPLQLVRELVWQTPNFSIKYGKNIAIVGQPMAGKTLLAMLIGYFNLKYSDEIIKAGYPQVIEVMKAGLLPEVEEILVLESENNLLKAMNTGVEKMLLKPLIQEERIHVAPIIIPRKEVKLTEDNKVVSIRRELIEQLKQQFDEAVHDIIDRCGENVLFIIDSMSAYKKLLDDKFGLLYEVLNKRENAVFDGVDTYRQSYYASRNTWWDNLMQIKRGFKGWNVDTYKESEVPEHWLKPGEDPYRIKWIGGTEHNLDMVYRVERDVSTNERTISILNGRYTPTNMDEHSFSYPLNSRMGAMPLIASMCEKLLLGES